MSLGWKRALRTIITAVVIVAIYMLILFALVGCKTKKVVEYRDSVRVEYQEVLVPDTVIIEIPAEAKERETRDSTSFLETSIAQSLAKMVWKNGEPWLYHSLENKPQKIKKVIYTIQKQKVIYRTRYVTRIEYKEKELTWWQGLLIRIGAIALLVVLGGVVWFIVKKKFFHTYG